MAACFLSVFLGGFGLEAIPVEPVLVGGGGGSCGQQGSAGKAGPGPVGPARRDWGGAGERPRAVLITWWGRVRLLLAAGAQCPKSGVVSRAFFIFVLEITSFRRKFLGYSVTLDGLRPERIRLVALFSCPLALKGELFTS